MAHAKSPPIAVFNPRTEEFLAHHALEARTYFRRMKGLLGQDHIEEGGGLVIPWCDAIHTFFMSMTIDVVFLDRRHEVIRLFPGAPAFRICWGGRKARTALELPAGAIARSKTQLGDLLQCQPNPSP